MTFRSHIPEFATLLAERIPLTGLRAEEDVRFTFLHALTTAGACRHWEVRFEAPLPTYPGRRLDTLVTALGGRDLAVEFKYHRAKLSTLPKPQLAGGLYSDLFRLGVAHATFKCECLFVYVTDSVMLTYLAHPKRGCSELFTALDGQRISLGTHTLRGKTASFQRALNGIFNPITVEPLLRTHIGGDLHLHVYNVEHVPDDVYKYR